MKASRAALSVCWFPLESAEAPRPKSRPTTVLFAIRFCSDAIS
jgi:hypothetical protein